MRNINEFSLELSASRWYVKGVFHLCTSTFTLYLCLNYSNICFVEMSVLHFKTLFLVVQLVCFSRFPLSFISFDTNQMLKSQRTMYSLTAGTLSQAYIQKTRWSSHPHCSTRQLLRTDLGKTFKSEVPHSHTVDPYNPSREQIHPIVPSRQSSSAIPFHL